MTEMTSEQTCQCGAVVARLNVGVFTRWEVAVGNVIHEKFPASCRDLDAVSPAPLDEETEICEEDQVNDLRPTQTLIHELEAEVIRWRLEEQVRLTREGDCAGIHELIDTNTKPYCPLCGAERT